MSTNNAKWIYDAVFLDEESVKILENVAKDVMHNIPEDWKKYLHHMTLCFNNGSEYSDALHNYYLKSHGQKVYLSISQIGWSDKAIAFRVNYAGEIANRIPHITAYVAPNGKPVESNNITNWMNLYAYSVLVSGTIGSYMSNKTIK